MAYDNTSGILTVDPKNETFDAMLDNIAIAIKDYRVTEVAGVLARDLGMLCTSPNVNRESLRRPIATPISKVAMNSEEYFQEKVYGFTNLISNSKDYSKKGLDSTLNWFNTISSKGYNVDLWGDSKPENGEMFCINQFNKYMPKAENRLLIASKIKPLVANNWPITYTTASVDIPYSNNIEISNSCIGNDEITLMGPLVCKYTMTFNYLQDVSDVIINIYGYHEINDWAENGTHKTVYTQFKIDSTNHVEGDTWVDPYGNLVNWVEVGQIILSMNIHWTTGNTDFTTIYDTFYNFYQNSSYKDPGSSLRTNMTVSLIRKAKLSGYSKGTSIVDTQKEGLYFKDLNKYFFIQGINTAVDDYSTPMESIISKLSNSLADQGSAGTNLLAILYIKTKYSYILKIINPFTTSIGDSDDAGNLVNWDGIVTYSMLGISESDISLIQYVDCLLCYGRAEFITPNGYADISAADAYILFPERYGYIRVMEQG